MQNRLWTFAVAHKIDCFLSQRPLGQRRGMGPGHHDFEARVQLLQRASGFAGCGHVLGGRRWLETVHNNHDKCRNEILMDELRSLARIKVQCWSIDDFYGELLSAQISREQSR